jgi:hypothetical protein
VSGRLDAARTGQATHALIGALAETNPDDGCLRELAQSLQAMSGRLDAAGAGKATDALIGALAMTTDPRDRDALAEGFQAVGGRLDTRQLVASLLHPLSVGRAQRTLLDLLGQRTRRTFRSPEQALDWAQANGIDSVPPGPAARAAP